MTSPELEGRSLYEVLGVDKNASPEEILAAYRRRAKETHPDKGGDEAEFKRVCEAFAVLSDAERREVYDETGVEDPRDVLAELGEFLDVITNPEHKDHVIDPYDALVEKCQQLKRIKAAFEERLSRVAKDLSEIRSHDDYAEMSTVDLVLQATAGFYEGKVQETDGKLEIGEKILAEFEHAKDAVSREDERNPWTMGGKPIAFRF